MVKRIRNYLFKRYNNFFGIEISRKIVVFESDDWGSIRMPSSEVYDKLVAHGLRVEQCQFMRYDSIANSEDFELLFDLLTRYKDNNGNHPVITANTIVANPDFDKIRDSNYQQYFYEPFTETIKQYSNSSFELWKQGMELNIFYPLQI